MRVVDQTEKFLKRDLKRTYFYRLSAQSISIIHQLLSGLEPELQKGIVKFEPSLEGVTHTYT